MVGFVGTFHGDAQVLRLIGAELVHFDAELLQVQMRHLLVEVLGQHIDADLVFFVVVV